jgi:TM2 domain-containing membrane protein YozV
VIVAYLLWAIGGWCGLHHFYLKRHAQAILWCDTHVPCPSPGPVLPGDAPKNPPS